MTAAQVAPGFRIDNGLLIEVDPSLAGYDEAHGRLLYRTLIERLRSVPGVESVGMAATVPFGMIMLGRNLQIPGSAPVSCRFNRVGEDYFKTLEIPLQQGRAFTPSEIGNAKTAPVVILDRPAAERLWPGVNPVGKHIQLLPESGSRGQDVEVVGVVAGVQESLFGQGLEPHAYVPFGQEYQSDMNIHLTVASNAPNLLETIRREIGAVDARLPVLALKTLRGHMDVSFDLWGVRTAARVLTIFGGVALLLAMVGLYALRAYTVARRTREIGIRLALGAKPSDARQMILREGLIVTSIGAASGLALSMLAGKVVASALYKVSSVDPLVFVSSASILGAVSLLACYLPALRASRVDPMVALRHE